MQPEVPDPIEQIGHQQWRREPWDLILEGPDDDTRPRSTFSWGLRTNPPRSAHRRLLERQRGGEGCDLQQRLAQLLLHVLRSSFRRREPLAQLDIWRHMEEVILIEEPPRILHRPLRFAPAEWPVIADGT